MLRTITSNAPSFAIGIAAALVFLAGTIALENPLIVAIIFCGCIGILFLCFRPKHLVYALFIYSFFVKFLVGDLGFPNVANYVCDGLLVLAIIFAICRPKKSYKSNPGFKFLGLLVLAFWLLATVSAIINAISPLLYIWACRNTFRLFGVLYCCVRLLEKDDVFALIKFITVFFWVNIAVCTYQYFILGMSQDNTNGLFGSGSGGNAMINVLMFALSALVLFGFMQKKNGFAKVLITLAACCYISAISEIKVYYVELILLVVLVVFLHKPTFKTVAIVFLSVVALLVGIQVLETLNPEFADFFNLTNIIKSATEGGYSNANNLNRLTAVTKLDSLFMNNLQSQLIGLGFGAGQYTQYFESTLYSTWGETLNWTWFTDAAIFLETGWMGLILYCACFIYLAIQTLILRKYAGENGWIVRMGTAVAVLSLVLIVYNCTLTVDPGCYFVGVLLSFVFVLKIEPSQETTELLGVE